MHCIASENLDLYSSPQSHLEEACLVWEPRGLGSQENFLAGQMEYKTALTLHLALVGQGQVLVGWKIVNCRGFLSLGIAIKYFKSFEFLGLDVPFVAECSSWPHPKSGAVFFVTCCNIVLWSYTILWSFPVGCFGKGSILPSSWLFGKYLICLFIDLYIHTHIWVKFEYILKFKNVFTCPPCFMFLRSYFISFYCMYPLVIVYLFLLLLTLNHHNSFIKAIDSLPLLYIYLSQWLFFLRQWKTISLY